MIPQDCPYSSTGERALEEDRGWGSTKREFLDAIFSEVPVHKLVVWFSALIFPFYKMLFMNRLEFSSMLCRVPGS